MFATLLLLPALIGLAAFLLYKQVGKREFLKMDLVQFTYAFVLSPILFIWMKSFLLFLAKNEVNPNLTQNELFAIDTSFSVLFLFFYAFVVIHSVTKSFEVKRYQDPLFDVFTHLESLHLWISHSLLYVLSLLIFFALGMSNIFLPLAIELSRLAFYSILTVGLLAGLLAFAAVWLSVFTENKFLLFMKLAFAVFFILDILLYFFFSPSFNQQFIAYWFFFAVFAGTVCASYFVERSERSRRLIERFHHKQKDGWTMGNFLTLLETEKDRNKR